MDVGATPTVPPTPIRRPEVTLEDRVEPIKGIRKSMAKAMSASLAIPHFGYKDEVILNELVRLDDFAWVLMAILPIIMMMTTTTMTVRITKGQTIMSILSSVCVLVGYGNNIDSF